MLGSGFRDQGICIISIEASKSSDLCIFSNDTNFHFMAKFYSFMPGDLVKECCAFAQLS